MSRHRRWLQTVVSGALGVAALAACRAQPRPPTTVTVTRIVVETAVPQKILVAATAEPVEAATAEPEPRKELVVCTTQEPVTLYPHASSLPVETTILHALFENDYTTLSYGLQPQGLEAIPSLAHEDARLRSIEVQAGDTVVNASGEIVSLVEGTAVRQADGSEIIFDGAPISIPQLVVDFTMRQRYWADGEPVTAADSIYSFQLDADPDTPTSKKIVARTASYEATGELSVRWVGMPGFWDANYGARFWRPLPRHLWQQYSANELLAQPAASQQPVGDGPFQLVEWVPGDHIRLEPNPYYYRADEGLPFLDSVIFRFLPDGNDLVEMLLAGACDVATPADLSLGQVPLLLAAETGGLIRPYFQTGTVYEHIDFGVNSWERYGDGQGRPDWFENVRVRQAITMCTDRQRMVDDILYGRSQTLHSYVPETHPLYPNDLNKWPYDPPAANRLLDDAGYRDSNGDGVREDPATGAPFRVTLGAGASDMQRQITQQFAANMRDCGIIIEPYYLPTEEWYANGPDGPLFGRRFDLGEFAWMARRQPSCFLYASWEITGPGTETNPATGQPYAGWSAANETGWWQPEFDTSCQAAQQSLPGMSGYEESHQQAQRIFAQNLPAIPLFLRLKIAATQPGVLNFQIDPTQPSALWNIYELDVETK